MITMLRFLMCGLLLAFQFSPMVSLAKDIIADDLRKHISVLASDGFKGRAPGTEGEALSVKYISETWSKAKLKPAGRDGSWFEPVALVQRAPDSAKIEFSNKGRVLKFVGDDILVIGNQATIQKSNVPLWFVGQGANADGAVAANIAGKAVLMLGGDLDTGPIELRSVGARRDALFEAGALLVLIVADDPAGWSAMRRQLSSRPIQRDNPQPLPRLEGSMSSDFAVAMITSAGLDWDKLRQRAKSGGFTAENLGIMIDVDVKTAVNRFVSANVIGKIAGRKRGSGAVLFLGHWDHLGLCQPPDAEDRICNGAVDNASGIAMLSEIARILARSKPDRDIYFLATTAEESGLLGAYAFAENPPFPLSDIVAAFNLDSGAIAPAGAPVAIVGRGMTELDPLIEAIAMKSKRKIEPTLQANAFVRRQDGWALMKYDVPALIVGGAFGDYDRLEKFLGSDYHGPKDEFADKLDLSGAVEDANLHVALGRYFSSTRKFKGNKSGR